MLLLDTSFLYALLDGRDARHREAGRWYRDVDEDLATTPLVLAEVDYVAGAHAGAAARAAFRRDVAAGAHAIEWWPAAPRDAVAVADRFGDIGISLADASLVVLAERPGTTRIATFDERRFRAVVPLRGARAFTLVPVDAG